MEKIVTQSLDGIGSQLTESFYYSHKKEDKTANIRWIGHTSTDYRRSHVEVFVRLGVGESIFSIPVRGDLQGTITQIRIRSRSEKVKVTLTETDCYKSASDDPHPRQIIWQETTDSTDYITDFDFRYFYGPQKFNDVPTMYAAIENQGGDSDGVSLIITFGY